MEMVVDPTDQGHEAGDGPSGHLRFISEKEDQDADADPD